MMIAVPSYLGFRARAADTAAKANLRAASTAASSYATDNTGVAGDADNNAATRGFQGMTTARLRLYDRGIKAAGADALSVYANAAVTNVNTFCIRNTISGRPWSALGPGITSDVVQEQSHLYLTAVAPASRPGVLERRRVGAHALVANASGPTSSTRSSSTTSSVPERSCPGITHVTGCCPGTFDATRTET